MNIAGSLLRKFVLPAVAALCSLRAGAESILPVSVEVRGRITGEWTLPAASDWQIPILIEAPGLAPAWATSQPKTGAPIDVALQRGGRVEVATDRVAPGAFLTLTRDGVSGPGEIPAHWQQRVWARPAAAMRNAAAAEARTLPHALARHARARAIAAA